MTFDFKNIAKPGQNINAENQEDQTNLAKKKLLRTMNAIKIISPIMQALLINPGVDKSEQEMTNNFLGFVKTASSLSQKTCEKLSIDPTKEQNYWIRNVFERLYSEMLKEQWIHNLKLEEKDIESLLDKVISFNANYESAEFNKIETDAINELRLSLVRATTGVINVAKTNYNLNRKLSDDLETIMNKILESSKKQLVELSDESFDDNHKTNLLKLLILEAGQLYSAAWGSYCQFAKNYYDNLKDADKIKFNKKYSQGLPITQLENEFDEYFDKMVVVTKKLLPQSTGTIEKRIKKS